MSSSTLDPDGLAERGSQRQIALYVNRWPHELNAAILKALPELDAPGGGFDWRSPLAHERYAEFRDEEFLGAIGRADLKPRLAEFWPPNGPVWDGLAMVELESGSSGVLLVEAKAHPGEIYGGGTKAGESGSERGLANRQQIGSRIAATQSWLGVSEDPERWMGLVDDRGSLYQLANRLAHLYWLRDGLANGEQIEAWLVNVLFADDASHKSTAAEDLQTAMDEAWSLLGLNGPPKFVGEVILPARAG